MARTKIVKPDEGAEPTREQIEDAIAGDEDLGLLAAFIDTVTGDGAEYTVFVYQMPRGARREWGFLYRAPLVAFDLGETLESMRDEYGGGEFRIQVRNARGQVVKSTEVAVIGKKPEAIVRNENEAALKLLSEKSNDSNNMFMAMLKMSQDASDRQTQMMRTSSEQMMQMMMQSSSQMMQVMAAIIGRPAAPATDPAAMIGAVASAMTALKPESTGGGIKEQLETFTLLKDLMGDGGGEKSMLGELAGLAGAFAPTLSAALANKGTGAQAPARANIIRPPAASNGAANPAIAPPPSTDDQKIAQMKMQALATLILAAAHENKEPEPYAEMLLDNVPEMFYDQLDAMLKAPDWKEQVTKYVPVIAQLPVVWCDNLRLALLDLLSDDGEESESEPLAPVDAVAVNSTLPGSPPAD